MSGFHDKLVKDTKVREGKTMLGQFPMVENMVHEQQQEMNKNLRRVEEYNVADSTSEKRMTLDRLLKLVKR